MDASSNSSDEKKKKEERAKAIKERVARLKKKKLEKSQNEPISFHDSSGPAASSSTKKLQPEIGILTQDKPNSKKSFKSMKIEFSTLPKKTSISRPKPAVFDAPESDGTNKPPIDLDRHYEELKSRKRVKLDFLDEPQSTKTRKDSDMVIDRSANAGADVDPLDQYMQDVNQAVEAQKAQTNEISNLNHSKPEFLEKEDQETPIKIDFEESIGFGQKKAKKKELSLVDHSKIEYEPFRKNFYVESPEISKLSQKEIELLRLELDKIKVRGSKPPKPIKKWSQCGLPLSCINTIKNMALESPTPIQAQAIPAIMSGRDVIGVAKTGSGKTLAFLLPMFRHVRDQRPIANMEGPIAIIMTPTRELAMQVFSECRLFSKPMGLRVACTYGGSPIKDNIADLKRGAEILVATPGRLIDLLLANSGRVTNLQRCTYLVLDEADRMFDMGFEQQVVRTVANVRPDAQRVLFSATFPRQMEVLARSILKKPLEIIVGARSVVCADVEQDVSILDEKEKFWKLLSILGDWYDESMDQRLLIFVDRQEAADNLLKDLYKRGYTKTLSLHGGQDQMDRDSTINDFKKGNYVILVATSVAARGLDVKELNVVINYDCPNHMEDYVHRVGRTGRAGRKGRSFTFITPEQDKYAPDLYKALVMSDAFIPPELTNMKDEFLEKVKRGEASLPGSGFGGKGLERIEKERDLIKWTQKKTYGAEDSDEEEEADENAGDEAKKVDQSVDASEQKPESASTVQQTQQSAITNPLLAVAQISVAKKAREIGKRLVGFPKPSAEIQDLLDSVNAFIKGIPLPINDSGDAGYSTILEVNDYPQRARARLGSKDILNMFAEMYRVSLTMRGEWVPPGRNPKPGEKKLHCVMDGPNAYAVEMAKEDLKRVLKEASDEAISLDPRLKQSIY